MMHTSWVGKTHAIIREPQKMRKEIPAELRVAGQRSFILPVAAMHKLKYDRLTAGTPFLFTVESQIRSLDPQGSPIFPVLSGLTVTLRI